MTLKNTAPIFFMVLMFMASACNDSSNPVTPPTSDSVVINSISPASASAGESVIISGSGFSETASNNQVTFEGDAQAEITAASTNELTVTVPEGAQDGPIQVAVGSESAKSGTFSLNVRIPGVYQNKTCPAIRGSFPKMRHGQMIRL